MADNYVQVPRLSLLTKPPKDKGSGVKPARVSELLRKPLNPISSWIEPAVLPKGGTLLFGGLDKIGKTFLIISLGRALAAGEPVFKDPGMWVPEACRVTLVDAELGEYTLKNRLARSMEDIDFSGPIDDRLWYVSKDPDVMLDSISGQQKLHDIVDATQPNVLLLDPINMMHDWDENSNNDVGKLFRYLARLKADFAHLDLSIVLAHHFGKPPSGVDPRFVRDPLDRTNFRGASKWTNVPDTLITCVREDNLPVPQEAWKLKMRTILRHGEGLPDKVLHVNEGKDLRVIWQYDNRGAHVKEVPLLSVKTGDDEDEDKPKNLFAQATGPKQLRFQ